MSETAATAWQCPLCHVPLNELVVPGHYGRALHVEHCALCQGVWFDAREMAQVDPKHWSAFQQSVAGVDGLVHVYAHMATQSSCPKCPLGVLAKVREPGLPSRINELLHCSACGGVFVCQAAVVEYLRWRDAQLGRIRERGAKAENKRKNKKKTASVFAPQKSDLDAKIVARAVSSYASLL